MKEYTEYLKDSFIDYTGKEHYFIIAAISQELPTKTEEIGRDDLKDYDIIHEVNMYIEDYGTEDYLGAVTKVLRLGVAMCNPVDQYNEKTGIMKATARARKSDPALYSRDKGTINTKVVRALLKQEAEYIKNNPNIIINGYSDMEARYNERQKLKETYETFSEDKKKLVETLQSNPKYLDDVLEYSCKVKRYQ